MCQEIDTFLQAHADEKYRDFNAKLTPTGYTMIGVRIPVLRDCAKKILKSGQGERFIAESRRDTFEHVLLLGFVTAGLKGDPQTYLKRLDAFLPYIDNWAVCDCVVSSCKDVTKFRPKAFEHILRYRDGNAWARRVLAVFMMDYFLTDEYIDRVLDVWRDMPQGEYYVDMGIAWGLSVALVKYYEKTAAKLAAGEYTAFVTNKAIQKARESYRISSEQKDALLLLKKK